MYSNRVIGQPLAQSDFLYFKDLIPSTSVPESLINEIKIESGVTFNGDWKEFWIRASMYYEVMVTMHEKYSTLLHRYRKYGMVAPVVDISETQYMGNSEYIPQRYSEVYGYDADINGVVYADVVKHYGIDRIMNEPTRVLFLKELCNYNVSIIKNIKEEDISKPIKVEYISLLDGSITTPSITKTIKLGLDTLSSEGRDRLGKLGVNLVVTHNENINIKLVGDIDGNLWVVDKTNTDRFLQLLNISGSVSAVSLTVIKLTDVDITLYVEAILNNDIVNRKVKLYNNSLVYDKTHILDLSLRYIKYKEDINTGFFINTNNPKAEYYISIMGNVVKPNLIIDPNHNEDLFLFKDSVNGIYFEVKKKDFLKYGIMTTANDALDMDKARTSRLKDMVKAANVNNDIKKKELDKEKIKAEQIKVALSVDKAIALHELSVKASRINAVLNIKEHGMKLEQQQIALDVANRKADAETAKTNLSIGGTILGLIKAIS